MQFTAAQIALIVNGQVEGDPAVAVGGFGRIEEAVKGQLAFLANPKYEEYLYTTGASVIILGKEQALRQPLDATIIRVPDAYTAFATLLEKYNEYSASQRSGIEQPSHIDPGATLGRNVYVGAFAYIGKNARIGDNVKIFPGVFIGDNCRIGDGTTVNAGVRIYQGCGVGKDVIIHSGAVIGADGFGFAPQPDGSYRKVPQTGNVEIGDRVEIGANATIDRATIGSTVIAEGAKVDNLVQIAHNVEVGSNTVIAAQTGISGSTKIGKHVMMGGQVGIVGHLRIADGSRINAQSGVSKSITEDNATVSGTPAFDYRKNMKSQALVRRLPELEERIRELEKKLASLEKK